jgi:hypothetical protein
LVPLKKILTAEIGRKPEISVSFEHVRPVFATLFDHILAPLHFTKPDNTYPDLQFDEFGSVGNALEMRLPPFCEVEAIAITAPDPSNHTFISSDLLLGEQPFSVTFAVVIDFNDASLDCIVPTSDEISSLRRIRLIGPVAAGHAKYRWIRPFMPVAFTGIAKVTRNSVLNRLANDAEWADIGKDVEILRRRHMNKSAPQGIVHGDLNLGNIMLDVSDRGLLPGVTPWLIDFARSRRDFLVHDFAELECDILTEIGVLVQGQGDPVTTIKGILDDCNKTAWDASTLSDTPSIRFLIDAVRSIRRAALCRGIDLHDYLTTLALYLIVKAKLLNKKKDDKASGRTRQTIRMAKQISDQVRQYHRSEPEPITPAECSCGRL